MVEIYRNSQWRIDESGLDTISPPDLHYEIDKTRLGELREQPEGSEVPPLSGWLLHMSAKTWVDWPAFVAAFAVALEAHRGKYTALPEGCFATSLVWAGKRHE